jgi:hypothetical protein
MVMDYSKTTPHTRYSLDVEAARKDLKQHGVDLKLATKIAGMIGEAISEYGDCPEVALACIASGYNAKCMAKQDSEFMYSNFDKVDTPAHKRAYAFSIVDAISSKHEDDIYEVISSWMD